MKIFKHCNILPDKRSISLGPGESGSRSNIILLIKKHYLPMRKRPLSQDMTMLFPNSNNQEGLGTI